MFSLFCKKKVVIFVLVLIVLIGFLGLFFLKNKEKVNLNCESKLGVDLEMCNFLIGKNISFEAKIGVSNNNFDLAPYLFTSFEKDGYLVMVVGFDGSDGERFNTLVRYPLFMHKDSNFEFSYSKLFESKPNGRGEDLIIIDGGKDNSENEIIKAFEKMSGHFINLLPYVDDPIDVNSPGIGGEDLRIKFNTALNEQIPYARALTLAAADNGVEISIGDTSEEVIKINSLEEAKSVSLDKIPMIPLQTFEYYD